ncbi:MAG: phosphoribosylamine---glycine ligase [Thermotogaceae bacterium]|nr:phosphoribosylamine---glycine ligase [Thermotogaceae bacterium]MDN5338622.1 phosphoribosylamine---glycine ligase [Thermotogaceae bacterium]
MRVLVVGSGGRESAIVQSLYLSKDASKIFTDSENPYILKRAEKIDYIDFDGLVNEVKRLGIDITVVGPENPLAEGIVDKFREKKLKIFGADKNSARLESSKIFAREFIARNELPDHKFEVANTIEEARRKLKSFELPVVIKYDGLALGKGVYVCFSEEEVKTALNDIFEAKKFGDSVEGVVIEEYLDGFEVSLMHFYDGNVLAPMPLSHDYKKALDGDRGPNTGGMGAFSPVKLSNSDMEDLRSLSKKLEKALNREGLNYAGVLYAGLMLTRHGPKILEFNVRFGDPETECVLPKLKTDLCKVLEDCVEGRLDPSKIIWDSNYALCLVIASKGYPEKYEKGIELENLRELEEKYADLDVFYSGVKEIDGIIVNNGGRVLAVSGVNKDKQKLIEKIYSFAEELKFNIKYYRMDIGKSEKF